MSFNLILFNNSELSFNFLRLGGLEPVYYVCLPVCVCVCLRVGLSVCL